MSQLHYNNTDFEKWGKEYKVNFFNSLGGFKSVNLLGTKDSEGNENLSIVSSVFHIGANPPLMGVIFRPAVVERHSLENILETKYFSLNHINAEIYKKAHQTSARYDKMESEFEHCGLKPEYLGSFFAPFVAESKLKIGLELCEKIDLTINGTVMVIAKIKETHLPSMYIEEDGFINLEKLGSVTVSGLDSYHTTQALSRLSYAKKGVELREI